MTPDTPVWISTARSGIAYHRIDGRKTVCGRYLGTDGEPRGFVLPLAQAVDEFGSGLCRVCDGSNTPPRVVPSSRDRQWTS